jgi:hypothetical protein
LLFDESHTWYLQDLKTGYNPNGIRYLALDPWEILDELKRSVGMKSIGTTMIPISLEKPRFGDFVTG